MSIKSFQSTLVILLLLLSSSVFSAAPDYDRQREAGDMQGSITFCGQPLHDALIYTPGTSFDARTNVLGQFKISYMQQGTYDLVVKKDGIIVGTINQAVITKKQTTDIGSYAFCSDLDGDGFSPPEDCDDSNPNINPYVEEACDDGIDNDCNGQVDEQCTTCTDSDADGYFAQSGCGTAVDCNDGNAVINPLANEVCDSIDNNCDGQVDEGTTGSLTWYLDVDGDNFGDQSTTITSCALPQGYTLNAGDCDDFNPNVNPAEVEYCDGIDNNCDGQVDEGTTGSLTWYLDSDGDGYGDPSTTINSCDQPQDYSVNADDCNDTDPSTFPGATEICDSIDNNCDGQVDEFCQ